MKTNPLRSFMIAALVLSAWIMSLVPLSAITYPTVWKIVPAQDADGRWWGALHVQTVPGVRYHLQRSTTLMSGSWQTIDSVYGMGEEWVCPVLPGNAPPVGTLPQEVIALPPYPAQPLKQVSLALGRTASGDVAIHFLSPDDGTMKQKVFAGLTLDPAWDEFDNSYFNPHGNFWMGISPQLQSPMVESPSPSTFGPQDEAVIAVFAASLGEMTANITDSIESAKHYSPPPDNAESKAFYRISADWGVDTNGGGRYDWQQLVLDGTDPFFPDPDGDKPKTDPPVNTDENGYPVPGLVAAPTPLAHFEQQTMTFERTYYSLHEGGGEPRVEVENFSGVTLSQADYLAMVHAGSFSSFKAEVDKQPFQGEWSADSLGNFFHTHRKFTALRPPPATSELFEYSRTRFRLKLNAPAPPGGYTIPLRVGIVRQKVAPDWDATVSFPSYTPGEQLYVDLIFTCPEGQNVSDPIEFGAPGNIGENELLTYIPGVVSTRENDVIVEGNVEGATPGPVPENGTCVVENEAFAVDFGNPSAGVLRNYQDPPLKVHWRSRQLNGNGTLGGWGLMKKPGYEAVPHEGIHTYVDARQKGVYQLQALLVLPNGAEIEFPFLRMKNERSILSSTSPLPQKLLKAGQSDYFGVAENSLALSVRNEAVKWLGSITYRSHGHVPIMPGSTSVDTDGKPKCNIFITHISNQVGATTPYFSRYNVPGWYAAPMAHEDWYSEPEQNIDLDLPGWKYMGSAGTICPGRVVASTNHCGIIDYDGSWINAGGNTVNKYLHFMDLHVPYSNFIIRARSGQY